MKASGVGDWATRSPAGVLKGETTGSPRALIGFERDAR